MFPVEYSIAGWFRWVGPIKGSHSMMRLTSNPKENNGDANVLGDRALAFFLYFDRNYYPSTYTYTNMFHKGEVFKTQGFLQPNSGFRWHYAYMGYNRMIRKIFYAMIFRD